MHKQSSDNSEVDLDKISPALKKQLLEERTFIKEHFLNWFKLYCTLEEPDKEQFKTYVLDAIEHCRLNMGNIPGWVIILNRWQGDFSK